MMKMLDDNPDIRQLIWNNPTMIPLLNGNPGMGKLLNNNPSMIKLLRETGGDLVFLLEGHPNAISLLARNQGLFKNNPRMTKILNDPHVIKLLKDKSDLTRLLIHIDAHYNAHESEDVVLSGELEKSIGEVLHNEQNAMKSSLENDTTFNSRDELEKFLSPDTYQILSRLPIENNSNTNALVSINQAILQKAYNDKESDDNKQDIKKLLASIGADFKDLEELEKELSFSTLKELDITKSSNSASIEALNNFNQTLIFNQTLSHDVYFKLLTKIGVGIKAWNFPCLAIVDGADCYNRPDMIEASAAHASDFDIPNNSSENEMVSVINYDLPNDKSDIHIQLHKACLDGDLNKAKIILNQGVNVDVVDHEHMTPVYYACLNGHVELAKFLMMTCKANISIRDNSDNTFLHMVCCNGHVGIAELLVKKDAAMVNTRNKSGYTPLYYACLKGDVKIAKLLIKNDAEIDIANQVDETLLLEACRHNQTAIIRLLVKVKKSALVNTCTSRLKTPLHYVCQKGNIKGAKKLLKHGA